MNKPDRFERVVESWWKKLPKGKLIDVNKEAAKLLRMEHRAVVRMVRKIHAAPDVSAAYEDGFLDAVDIILDQLTRRAK